MYWKWLFTLLFHLYDRIDRTETFFLKMNNIYMMVNQIVFLTLADRLFLSGHKITCLYTLMFYNVVTYCISYIKELIEKENWSPYVMLTETSKIKHLAMSVTKIVFEWTKAITFVITLTFVLLIFGLEQGLKHYKPTRIYMMITWLYYSFTEKMFLDMFPLALKVFHLEIFDNLEELYVPVLLSSFTISISAVSIVVLIPIISWKLLLIAIYINVYLGLKDLLQKFSPALKLERQILSRYKKATPADIKRFDDICAICLCSMIRARVTPCHHIFHTHCLRQCLKTNNSCPMCKRELNFETIQN